MTHRTASRVLVATAALVAVVVTALAAGPASGAPAKPPIKIMVISSWANIQFDFPHLAAVIENVVRPINKAGGLNGQQIEILSCNDKFDGNEAEKCAREAVEAGATAMVGGVSIFGTRIYPVLTPAGIPWLGNTASFALDFIDPLSFPITSGGGLLNTAPIAIAARSCKRIAFVATDTSNVGGKPFTDAAFKANQKDPVASIVIPRTVTDFTQYAVQIARSNPDCVVTSGLQEPQWPQWLTALKGQGLIGNPNVRHFTASPSGLTDNVVAKNAKDTNGFISATYSPAWASPLWDPYRKAERNANNLGKYKPRISGGTELRTYAAWLVFADVAKQIKGTISAKTFLPKLRSSCNVQTGGILPPINFCQENPIAAYRRLFNTKLIYTKADNGILKPFGKGFTDMLPIYRRGSGQ